MGLKLYHIDTSPLPADAQDAAIHFIEINSFTHNYIPYTNGCFECTWEESVNLSLFPVLSGCIVREL